MGRTAVVIASGGEATAGDLLFNKLGEMIAEANGYIVVTAESIALATAKCASHWHTFQ